MNRTVHEMVGRLEVTGAVGEKLQAQVDAAVAEENQHVGAAAAFKEAAKKVMGVGAHVAKAMQDGEFKGLDEAAVEAKIQEYLSTAAMCCANLIGNAKAQQLVAVGKQTAAKEALAVVAKYHTSAKSRHDQLTLELENPTPPDNKKNGKTRIRGKGRPTMAERRAARAGPAKKKAPKKKATRKKAKNGSRTR